MEEGEGEIQEINGSIHEGGTYKIEALEDFECSNPRQRGVFALG